MRNRTFKQLPLTLAVVGCLYSAGIFAQENPAEEELQQTRPAATETTELEKITVTGSLLRRAEFDSVSPVQIITADTSVTVGQVDTASFLQKSSVAAGSTQINHQFSGFIVEGGTGSQTLNLRGLGSGRTLVLLNGRRPGPAGTRGQVGSFDLNTIPSSILQRAEIVKDGSSSIYGSDAVAGVVNLITRKNIDRPEFTITGQLPFVGGGERFTVSGATGWNFDNGNIAVAAEYYRHHPLRMGDRRYLRCAEDLIYDENGNRIDLEDRSITGGTVLGGCSSTNLYANTIIDYFDPHIRYIPSPDGVTVGNIPGYRPRDVWFNPATGAWETPRFNNPLGADGPYFDSQLNFPFFNEAQLIDRQERSSLYASSSFSFGSVNWMAEALYNRRETNTHRWRQFFPVVQAPVDSGYGQIIMPFPSDQNVTVDYMYLSTGLDGLFSFTDTWAWQTNASWSRSDGDYTVLAIDTAKTGDLTRAGSGTAAIDYLKPCILSGECMSELVAAVGHRHTGNTVYDQFILNATISGELFNLPAGAVGAALGVEYRKFSIDDQPSAFERSGMTWGQSSAQPTVGEDKVKEIFAEIEIPLLKGVTGFEALTANLSARAFDYDSVDGSDHVWKAGLSWQIVPSLRIRSTRGTSYRAPGLYELYLGNLSGFVNQVGLDPCIDWGNSTNDFIKANCAAAGIPINYLAAGTSSAQVYQGGGAGFLTPERSTAQTVGLVFTPSWAPFSIALDYFDYDVRDQISTLGAGQILWGCYGSASFPNNFCDMFNRNPSTAAAQANMITDVWATYVNVNKQRTRGWDMLARYDGDFAWGKVEVETGLTYTIENFFMLFDSTAAGGQTRDDLTGYIGYPEFVGNLRAALTRGDWTYTYFLDYVGETSNMDLSETVNYLGRPNSRRDITADARFYHTLSARYSPKDNWSLLVGVNNLLDTDPPFVSTGVATRYGNVPAFATQYDLYGRTLFVRYNHKF